MLGIQPKSGDAHAAKAGWRPIPCVGVPESRARLKAKRASRVAPLRSASLDPRPRLGLSASKSFGDETGEPAGFVTKALGCKKPHRPGAVTRRAGAKRRSGHSPSRESESMFSLWAGYGRLTASGRCGPLAPLAVGKKSDPAKIPILSYLFRLRANKPAR